jgi:TATA-box binding protein (TBP) (component of TFIID and TFIIIB)
MERNVHAHKGTPLSRQQKSMKLKEPKMVLVADLQDVSLENLAQNCEIVCEPEQFTGGILRMDEPIVRVLVYTFGRVVIAGVKNSKDMLESAKNQRCS